MERRSADAQTLPVQWKFLTPMVWAPAFPIIRMTMGRVSKSAQPWVLGLAIVVANLHGLWLIQNPDLSDDALSGVPIGPNRSGRRV